jgi:hypothetical protein
MQSSPSLRHYILGLGLKKPTLLRFFDNLCLTVLTNYVIFVEVSRIVISYLEHLTQHIEMTYLKCARDCGILIAIRGDELV